MASKEIKVSDPQDEVLKSTKQRILSLAGQGGGKSHIAGLLSADFAINYPFVRGFIGANTYGQLTKSTLDRIFKVWLEEFGWTKGVEYVVDNQPQPHFKIFGPKLKSYENTISFNNGALIFLGSLDNFKAIDGSEFAWGILDETKDTKEEAVKEVITGRLRQPGLWVTKEGKVYNDIISAKKNKAQAWNPLYVLTSPAKVYWINDWFELSDKYEDISKKIFSKTDYYSLTTEDKHIVIYSAYHNEENLPENFIEQRKKDLAGSPSLIDSLIYGSPIAKAGGEFFGSFDRLKHVSKVPFLNGVNIHFSFDFNSKPYNTLTCWQIIRKEEIYQVRCFKEICLQPPNNETEQVCNAAVKQVLEPIKSIPGVFYYGDASGSNETALSKDHHFDIIERVLKKYLNESSHRVLNRNPSVVKTRDFINKIFAGGFPIEIIIDDGCKNLITDLEFLKQDPDGGKLIEYAKDKITGQKYEKFGHTSDSMRYFLISAFSGLFQKD